MERVFDAEDYDGSAHFEIPFGFTTIGPRAFSNSLDHFYSLKSVTIPTTITTIGKYAFADCRALVDVVIPDSVTKIEHHAFETCCHKVEDTRPESERYGAYNFVYAGLESVVIPNSVTEIGDHAFSECRALKSIVIPGSIKKIKKGTFAHCNSLESVTLGEGLECIERCAFDSCWSLEAIQIPEGVTEIGDYAFRNCELLKGVVFPSSLVTIGVGPFGGRCHSLKTFVFMQRYADLVTDGAYSEAGYTGDENEYKYEYEYESWDNNIQRWERVIFPRDNDIERVYVHADDIAAFSQFRGFVYAYDPSECPKLLRRPTGDFEAMKAIVARDKRLQTYIHRPTLTRDLLYGPVPAFTEAQKRWISTFMMAVASDRLPHLPAEIKELILEFVARDDTRSIASAITETQDLFFL